MTIIQKSSIPTKDTEFIANEAISLQESDPDLQEESSISLKNGVNTLTARYSQKNKNSSPKPFIFVPLTLDGRTHIVTKETISLVDEVPLKVLKQMTEFFYENAFLDHTLDKFIRSHSDPHGARFAKWIHQKLSGSNLWDKDRKLRDKNPVKVAGGRYAVVHDRSSAHAAAWNSPKRDKNEVGRHFQLDESRVWMRLHFWAMRETGLLELSPSFADYYVRFIGHFVRVYENLAPLFARDSFRWSENKENIKKYKKRGRKMKDVIGISMRTALAQIPEDEANDVVWPYNKIQEYSNGNESW